MGKKKKKTSPLRPIEIAAIAEFGKTCKLTRDKLKPGSAQMVDFTVHFQGAMTVGHLKDAKKTESPKKETILAIVLSMVSAPLQRRILKTLKDKSGEQLAKTLDEKMVKRAKQGIDDISTSEIGKVRGDVTGVIGASLVERSD